MAKIHAERLKKRYGDYSSYNELIQKIIARNAKDISIKIAQSSADAFTSERNKVRADEKALVMPHPKDVVNRSQHILKAQDRGATMSDNLRDRLTKNLRDIMSKPEYTRRRGALAGTLKTQAVDDFRDAIKKTFENYTKVDPSIGVPANIRNIAVTEVRTAVNQTKSEFMKQMQEKNPDITITKVWRHNRKLSLHPRRAHQEMSGVQVPYAQNFEYYNADTGNRISTPHPHAAGLPPEESIGCSCEVQYRVERYKVHESPYRRQGD